MIELGIFLATVIIAIVASYLLGHVSGQLKAHRDIYIVLKKNVE